MLNLLNPLGLVRWQWGYWHPSLHFGFEVLGYLTSFAIYKHQAVVDTLTPPQRKRLKLWTLGGAILGAKAVPLLEVMGSPLWGMALWSGKSLAGGLLGGIVGTELGKWRGKLGTASTGDVLVWPLVWGSLVGRLGCAATAVFDGMLGQTVPPWLVGLAGVVGVNTQTAVALSPQVQSLLKLNSGWLFNLGQLELFGLVTLAVVLWRMSSRKKNPSAGWLFYSFCVGYFALRLGLEVLKHGSAHLTVVQGVSLLGLLWAVYRLILPLLLRRGLG
jgi:phosphatidylglycerol:prolipoprotein diacylglycerol transferase